MKSDCSTEINSSLSIVTEIEHDRRPSSRRARALLDFRKTGQICFYVILVSCCIYGSLFIYHTSFLVGGERFFTLFDDAMISMRYAKNLADGYGLVWNPGGERVEGYTNPLWVFFMALFHLLPLSESKISLPIQLSGIGFLLINLFLVRKIADFISNGDRLASLTAVFLTAFYYPLIYWSLRGMEVSLLVCLADYSILLALRSIQRRRPSSMLYLLLGIATLVRPDMLVPAVSILIYVLLVDPRNRTTNAVLGLTVLFSFVVLQTAFRLVYFGEFLPNTYYLKMTGYPALLRMSRGLIVASKFLCTMFPLVLLAPFIYGLLRRNTQALLLLWIFATQLLYSIYVGGDAWELWGRANRYVVVAVPALFVLLGCTLADMRRLFADSSSGKRIALGKTGAAVSVVAIVAVAQFSFNAVPGTSELREWLLLDRPYTADADQRSVETALMLKQITTPKATIAVLSSGALPYFAHRTAIDMLGKNDKKIAREKMRRLSDDTKVLYKYRAFYPGHLKWDYSYSIGCLQPDVVVRIWGPREEAAPYLDGRYVRVWSPRGRIYLKKDSKKILWEDLDKVEHTPHQ
jgi:arabinofuranosyltransferase